MNNSSNNHNPNNNKNKSVSFFGKNGGGKNGHDKENEYITNTNYENPINKKAGIKSSLSAICNYKNHPKEMSRIREINDNYLTNFDLKSNRNPNFDTDSVYNPNF